jgi:C4-dicarboxylate-specific signal transduction histidine kinase
VVIATPNHWHALATIWALQAGKHVYVEKPASHTVLEGRLMTNAARAYGKIVQVGTMNRSRPAVRQAIKFIQDGGIGIQTEAIDGLFQPFQGTFAKGSGLGLAIVHRIVTDYRGEIQVSSQPGAGTTVTVSRCGGRRMKHQST